MSISKIERTRIENKLPVAREGLPFFFIGAAITIIFFYTGLLFPAILMGIISLFILYFFRDPERGIDADENAVLTPADGKIIDIRHLKDSNNPLGEPAIKLSVFMSIFNVHVNRAPAPGTVRFVQYVKGKFHSAHSKKSSLENEHNFVGLETQGGGRILVNLIAGIIARRIVCTVSPGQALSSGQRIGMVKFGSRAELYLPGSDRYEVLVSPGAKVKAGRDVLAVRKDAGHGAGVS